MEVAVATTRSGNRQCIARLDVSAINQISHSADGPLADVAPRFCRIANGGLQDLTGDRLRGVDQLLQRSDTGVGSLQNLHAVADTVEQVVDVVGAVVKGLAR